MAPPSKYNKDYHDDWAWSLASKGATDEEIAKAMRISVRTFHRWKKEYPSFLESLSNGKDMADAKVEKMLYKRALGYDVEETERIVDVNSDGSVKPVRVKTTKKHIAPDTMAQMYWLNNRRRGEWGQRQEPVPAAEDANNVVFYLPDNGRNDGDGNGSDGS